MRFKVQRLKGDTLPPRRWLTVEADSMENAAHLLMRRLAPRMRLTDLPVTIHVGDRKMVWPNGAPFRTEGYTFDVTEEER